MPLPRLTRRQDPVVTRFRDTASGRPPTPSLVLLDGPHVILEALRAGVPVETLLTTSDSAVGQPQDVQELRARAEAAGTRIYPVTTAVLDAASPVRTPSGHVALASWTPAPIGALWSPAPALVVGLVDVQDPGNVGAAIRCADGLNATGVAALDTTAAPGGWKAIRGAMGSTFRLPVARGHAADVVTEARHQGVRIVATVARGTSDAVSAHEADLTVPSLLLLGNEGAGLPESLVRDADTRVYLAMREGLDSFNVSVTAGLLLYEARRQRTPPRGSR